MAGLGDLMAGKWRLVAAVLAVLYAAMFALDWRFSLALLPLIVVLVGMVALRRSGAVMAVVGWVIAVLLAVAAFHTDWRVALLGSAEGILKSLGISVAVAFTMYLIFLMKETGWLGTVSESLRRIARTKEDQALFIGIGFGTFATSLGIVTPALFPPLLMAMGFGPLGAVTIAVLGYNASTSFALLSIPVTIPAEVSPGLTDGTGFTSIEFAYQICLYLPVVSVAISFAMLYVIGRGESVRRGAVQALIVGAVVAFSCLGFVAYEHHTGATLVPLRILGVVAGLLSMGALYGYQVARERLGRAPGEGTGEDAGTAKDPVDLKGVLRAFYPLIVLTVLAGVIGFEVVAQGLSDLPGDLERVTIFENRGPVDLNVLSQIYTWILIAIVISVAVMRPGGEVMARTNRVWIRRIWSPFVAYSVYFAIAYVMAYSAMELVDGSLVPTDHFDDYNMNVALAAGLAAAFGSAYMWVASTLGLFGAIVGGSETGSNVLFMNVQWETSQQVGMSRDQFLVMFGGHGVAGGVASAVTPSKVNNAVVTIGEGPELEAEVMRKLLVITLALTLVINVMTGVFVMLVA